MAEKSCGLITLKNYILKVHLGTTEKERKHPQKIALSIDLYPETIHSAGNDNLESTINYSVIRTEIADLLCQDSFNLIETVAEKIAEYLEQNYPIRKLTITIKKFPYRDIEYVSYQYTHERES